MGLYAIDCPVCKKPFMWFSGNTDQRCPECKEEDKMENKIKLYPKTEFFEVIDTIGVPHPFCITGKHVVWASDKHFGKLGRDAIISYEKSIGGKPSCGVPQCNLTFEKHETALAIKCKIKDNELTKQYLQSIVEQCEADGFAGFVLVKGWEE
jgi:hypothetical protein